MNASHTPAVRILEYLEHPQFVALHGEQPANDLATLVAERNALLEALKACIAFWDAPRPTFGLNEQRKAELADIQHQARQAIEKAQA